MITIYDLFQLNKISQAPAEDKLVRAVLKDMCDGIPAGTPFVMSKTEYDNKLKNAAPKLDRGKLRKSFESAPVDPGYTPVSAQNDEPTVGIRAYMPCSMYGPGYEFTIKSSRIVITDKPAFVYDHVILFAETLDNVKEALTTASKGGSVSVIIEDVKLADNVLKEFLPGYIFSYKYTGNLGHMDIPSPSCPTDFKSFYLVLTFFHPRHCCAIYTPNVDGLFIKCGLMPIEYNKAVGKIHEFYVTGCFASNFSDNILQIDGTSLISVAGFDSDYMRHRVAGCFKSLVEKNDKIQPAAAMLKAARTDVNSVYFRTPEQELAWDVDTIRDEFIHKIGKKPSPKKSVASAQFGSTMVEMLRESYGAKPAHITKADVPGYVKAGEGTSRCTDDDIQPPSREGSHSKSSSSYSRVVTSSKMWSAVAADEPVFEEGPAENHWVDDVIQVEPSDAPVKKTPKIKVNLKKSKRRR